MIIEGFQTTHPTFINNAIAGDREALAKLIDMYSRPLNSWLCRRINPETADQLLADFLEDRLVFDLWDEERRKGKISRALQRNSQLTDGMKPEYSLLERWDRTKGRFRVYLLGALRRYLIDYQIRAGKTRTASLEFLDETNWQQVVVDLDRLEQIEEIVQTAMERTIPKLREKKRQWNVFVEGMVIPAAYGTTRTAQELCELCVEETDGCIAGLKKRIRECFEKQLELLLRERFEDKEDRDEFRRELSAPEIRNQLSLGIVNELLPDSNSDSQTDPMTSNGNKHESSH